MQIMVTNGALARSRVLQFNPLQVVGALAALVVALMLLAGAVYHFVFLKAARDGWPVVSQVVRLVVRDENAQRERFMRENLDAMAQKVGEMQAKLIKLEAMGERVSGLAGVKGDEFRSISKPDASKPGGGQGGPFVPVSGASLEVLNSALDGLDERTDQHFDLFTLIESRLFEARLKSLMIPNSRPLEGPVGSGFGFRTDPFSGRAALHTGLDFPADTGTPILASAGGVVITAESHPAYGNVVEVDHGNRLVTRYAHASKVVVKAGDLVKRGQVLAHVGNSGRSTGPHLHFEVLVEGVPQDPAKFLAGNASGARTLASRTPRSARSGRPRPEPSADLPPRETRPDPPPQE